MEHHHDYQTVSHTKQGMVEVCKECKHRLVTNFGPNGRIDNRKYLSAHVRDTAQPDGITAPIFKRYYGNKSTKQ
jgi:hypothetical protein